MTNIIEKDSPLVPLLTLAGIFLILIGGGLLELAYIGGVFTGKDQVAANDRRITEQAAQHSPPSAVPTVAKP